MGMIEDTSYITDEVNLLCQRLSAEGMDPDLIYACLIEQAAFGYANIDGAELMPRVFRETADQMEAGEYKLATVSIDDLPKPRLTVIEGGGGSKV